MATLDEKCKLDTNIQLKMNKIIILSMLTTFSVVGTIGNLLVIIVFSRKKDRTTTSNLFIVALASSDVIACSVAVPWTIFMVFNDYCISSDTLCKMYNFFITSSIPFSAYLIAAISVDRYLCICHPLRGLMNIFRAKIVIISLAIVAGIEGLIAAFLHGTYHSVFDPVTNISTVSNTRSCDLVEESRSFANAYKYVHLSAYWALIPIVFVLYTFIFRSISKRRKQKRERDAKTRQFRMEIATTTKFAEAERDVTVETAGLLNNGNSSQQHCTATSTSESNSLLQPPSSGLRATASSISSMSIKTADRREAVRRHIADAKTAAMLFVVAVIFVLAYLPAGIMICVPTLFHDVFYAYFLVNMANPLIYSFMNPTFRRDLRMLSRRSTRSH